MTLRQLLILAVLSLPLVTVFDLPSALRAMKDDWLGSTALPQPTFSAGFNLEATNGELPVNDERVLQLSDQLPAMTLDDRRSDSFPDTSLVDQNGRSVFFRSDLVRDKVCCIIFFYINCEGTCPGTLQRVRQLRRAMATEFPEDVLQFVAVTLDPEQDTPDRLREFANQLGVNDSDGLADWRFCTGELADIETLRRSLGLYEIDPVLDADRSQHAALITFGNDQTNRWAAMPSGATMNDLEETFLRIAGTSERQRFGTRIARSAMINANAVTTGLESSTERCPKEICSLPEEDILPNKGLTAP